MTSRLWHSSLTHYYVQTSGMEDAPGQTQIACCKLKGQVDFYLWRLLWRNMDTTPATGITLFVWFYTCIILSLPQNPNKYLLTWWISSPVSPLPYCGPGAIKDGILTTASLSWQNTDKSSSSATGGQALRQESPWPLCIHPQQPFPHWGRVAPILGADLQSSVTPSRNTVDTPKYLRIRNDYESSHTDNRQSHCFLTP